MTKAKKLISVLLGILLLFTVPLMGCGNNVKTPNEDGTPGQNETPGDDVENPPVESKKADVFLIGSWVTFYDYEIKSHEKQMKIITDAGVNFTQFPASFQDSSVTDDYEEWKEIDRLCTKYGLYYNFASYQWHATKERFANDMDIAKKLFANGGGEYMLTYHIWDEPFYDKLEEVAWWVNKYYSNDPEHLGWVNLNGSSGVEGVDMYTYVDKWATLCEGKIDFIGYDLYPFGKGVTHDIAKFQNMEALRQVGLKHGGLKTHAFVQSNGWNTHIMPNYEQISWDAWGLVAYGFKAFSYFNYVNPSMVGGGTNPEGFNESFIMAEDGSIRNPELFKKVSDMNWRIRAVGDIVVKYDATKVYHNNNYYGMTTIPEDYFITTEDTQNNLVLSYFEPKDGTSPDHVMLFNNSWTDAKEFEFNVTENSGLSGIEWFNPDTKEYEAVDISSGKFSVSFAAGEGKLFRISGDVQA